MYLNIEYILISYYRRHLNIFYLFSHFYSGIFKNSNFHEHQKSLSKKIHYYKKYNNEVKTFVSNVISEMTHYVQLWTFSFHTIRIYINFNRLC